MFWWKLTLYVESNSYYPTVSVLVFISLFSLSGFSYDFAGTPMSASGKHPHSRRLVVFSLSPFVNPNEGRSHLVRKSIRSEALYLLSCCGGMWMALWAKNVHLSFFTIDSVRKKGWIEFQGRTLRKLVLKWSTTDKSWNRSKYNPHLQLLKSKLAVVRLALE